MQNQKETPHQTIIQVAQLNARFGRPHCPQSHKYSHCLSCVKRLDFNSRRWVDEKLSSVNSDVVYEVTVGGLALW